MILKRLDAIAAAAGGKLVTGRPETPIHGLFSDTRSPVRGGLFVALRGENFDGNKFARDAVEKCGASAVMLDCPEAAKSVPNGAGAILVDDSRAGLLGIAARHRESLSSLIWFGVTGSVGKSSTKEMLAHILDVGGGFNVHKAKASFNNAVGLSHTVLGATAEHHAVVLELGTNHPGEIRQLASVAKPNIAILTCAAESHLEAFHTVKNVAIEKADIFAFQGDGDSAVVNADDPHFPMWNDMLRGRCISFGLAETADVRAKHIRINENGCAQFMARFGDELAECRLHVPGVHQVSNALAAMAAACSGGIPLDICTRALQTFEGIARRFAVKQAKGMIFIDDAYNANPASFAAALDTLKTFKTGRRFVIAGDMLELGERSSEYHRELGKSLASCHLEGLITVGLQASIAGKAAAEAKTAVKAWTACATPEEAAKVLAPKLQTGDVVLVKGSHGMKLEKALELLM